MCSEQVSKLNETLMRGWWVIDTKKRQSYNIGATDEFHVRLMRTLWREK